VIVAGTCGLASYRVTTDGSGATSLALAWRDALQTSTPIVAGGVLFAAGSGAIRAFDPATGKQLWSDSVGEIHWESPIVHDGMLFIADEGGALTAFGL